MNTSFLKVSEKGATRFGFIQQGTKMTATMTEKSS